MATLFQATDQFALARQMAMANKNSKQAQWKRSVVERMLQLDMEDEKDVTSFLDSIMTEQ